MQIYDMLGMKMNINTLNKTETNCTIDVSSLPPGIYYLRAGNQMQKFVIQR